MTIVGVALLSAYHILVDREEVIVVFLYFLSLILVVGVGLVVRVVREEPPKCSIMVDEDSSTLKYKVSIKNRKNVYFKLKPYICCHLNIIHTNILIPFLTNHFISFVKP